MAGTNDHLHNNDMINVPERKMGPGYYPGRQALVVTDLFIPDESEQSPRAETPQASNGNERGGGSGDAPNYAFTLPSAASSSKPSNPKDMIGSDKVPMSLVTGTTKAYLALAHLEGHLKYGLVNWREAGVRASIYLDAIERHFEKFKDGGEWADEKTKVPHLASIMACCSIILDAHLVGKLTDDRPKSNQALPQLIDDLSENVKHLKELFKDHSPRHYTIADNDELQEIVDRRRAELASLSPARRRRSAGRR